MREARKSPTSWPYDSGVRYAKTREHCATCGSADENVAMCTGCYRNRCDRKKCAAEHSDCFTPDELADP